MVDPARCLLSRGGDRQRRLEPLILRAEPIWTAFEFSILRVVTMHNGLIWMARLLRICAGSGCLASDLLRRADSQGRELAWRWCLLLRAPSTGRQLDDNDGGFSSFCVAGRRPPEAKESPSCGRDETW